MTEFGREQCRALRPAAAAVANDVELVVVSPLSRAIETALISFQDVRKRMRKHARDTLGGGGQEVCTDPWKGTED